MEYIYVGQIEKRRTSPVFASNMQNTTKHSARSGRFRRAPDRLTEPIQMQSSMTFILGNMYKERMIIRKKMATVLVPSIR